MDSLGPGARLGRYEIERQLGRGALGAVFLARDAEQGEAIALRVVADELAAAPDFFERLRQEAERAAALDHPNVARVRDAGRDGPLQFLATEYVDGQPLSHRLGRGPLAPAEVVGLARQLGRALDHAHAAGVLHWDVRPSNVILEPGGRARLTGFGPAAAARHGRPDGTDETAESPLYLSAEQAAGRAAERRSDLYGLAAVLYTVLAGRPPFDHPSRLVVLVQQMTEPPPPITSLNPDLPAGLNPVFAKALAKAPEERYASGAALAGSLERALAPLLGAVDPDAVKPSRTVRSRDRRLIVGALAAVGLALLLGLTIPRVLSSRDGEAPEPPEPTAVVGGRETPIPSSGTAAPASKVAPAAPPTSPPGLPVPPTVQPTPETRADEIVAQALAAVAEPWSRDDWDAVIARLEPLRARYPENAVLREKLYAAHFEQGRGLERAEKPAAARAPYLAAVELDPDRADARDRLRVVEPVGRALLWQVYRWQPGPASEGGGVRAYQDGEAFVLRGSLARTSQAAWMPTAVEIGGEVTVEALARLASGPGGLDLTLWDSGTRQPRYTLRSWRAESGVPRAEVWQWRGAVGDLLYSSPPNAPFLLGDGSPNLLRLEARSGRLTASVNGTALWSGSVGPAGDYAALGVYSLSIPATAGLLEYHVYEPR